MKWPELAKLEDRILEVLWTSGKNLVLAAIGPAGVAVAFLAGMLHVSRILAQTAVEPKFEVASIKPHVPGQPSAGRAGFNGGPGTSDPGFLRCNNCTLSILIREAYNLRPYEIRKFTDPLAFFDVSATVTQGSTKEQERRMLQSLLAERFHLAAHRESSETTVYELVPAKNGPKLTPSTGTSSDAPPTSVTFDKDGFVNQPPPPPDGRIEVGRSGKSRIRGINESMADFANRLSFALNRPIVDRTGLTGKYDYALIFDTSVLMPASSATPDADTPAPIEVLLGEQLGLRLEKRKGSIEILVVDHIDKTPTDN
jgi:uncharacterized protein (TIGR03435 family)